jgi:hypothetical protein
MRRHIINRAAHSLAAVGIALLAMLGMVTFTSTDTAEAAFNVFTFACDSSGDIKVDVRGLGNTNVCVDGSVHVEEDCACVNNSGSCPQATNKQSTDTTTDVSTVLQPKNGRVNTTVLSGVVVSNTCITPPSQCGSGQTARPINQLVEATWTLCTTTASPGEPCSCPQTGNLATTSGEGCTTSTHFESKNDSCDALFD